MRTWGGTMSDSLEHPLDDLLDRVADGDQTAFGELYTAMWGPVYCAVQRSLVDHSQSEEVAQEVFLEVWQLAATFDRHRGRAANWVLTVARRRAIDRVRASEAARRRDRRTASLSRDVPVDTVAEGAEIRSEHERALRALRRLTPPQQETVGLAYHGGYSQPEIARMIGVPVGTVKTRLRDGLIRLRAEMT